MTTADKSAGVRFTADPASYGATWNLEGTECQLVALRGTERVLFGMRRDGNREWSLTGMASPERFGALPIPSVRAWREYVAAFRAAGLREDASDRVRGAK